MYINCEYISPCIFLQVVIDQEYWSIFYQLVRKGACTLWVTSLTAPCTPGSFIQTSQCAARLARSTLHLHTGTHTHTDHRDKHTDHRALSPPCGSVIVTHGNTREHRGETLQHQVRTSLSGGWFLIQTSSKTPWRKLASVTKNRAYWKTLMLPELELSHVVCLYLILHSAHILYIQRQFFQINPYFL